MNPTPTPAAAHRPLSLREVVVFGEKYGDIDAFFREYLDRFYSSGKNEKEEMLYEEPPLTKSPETDAFLAAAAEHLAFEFDLEVPRWTQESSRFLHKAYFPGGLESLKALFLVQSPVSFRRRMIFVQADPLYRPRRERKPQEFFGDIRCN